MSSILAFRGLDADMPPAPASSPVTLGLDFRFVLDQIDYGIVVASPDNTPCFMNSAARTVLGAGRTIRVDAGRLRCAVASDGDQLRQAVGCACRQARRTFLLLGRDDERLAVSVLPLTVGSPTVLAMLAFGRRHVCEALTSIGYARCHALTPAESRVLDLLCEGVSPEAIAQRLRVAVSTIRSQISSIRAKTGARSVAALVRECAMLPPMSALLGPVAEPRESAVS